MRTIVKEFLCNEEGLHYSLIPCFDPEEWEMSSPVKLSATAHDDEPPDPVPTKAAELPGRRPTIARVPPLPVPVKINVEGAFIVEEQDSHKSVFAGEHVHYEHKDIRLPYHTDVVSHVAVDVS